MTDNISIQSPVGMDPADDEAYLEPSFINALPHYLPLLVFPLLIVAARYGSWWLLAPAVFMFSAGFMDRIFGVDGLNMNPRGTSDRRFLWYNIPVWGWALMWPPTLIYGLMQIFGAFPDYALNTWWEGLLLALLLTMEAQAVFIVGHELVHRRTTWERRIGEFLLASCSYPQYATEHLYIHHAKVGTPHDAGSAPKGESFWTYFPKEIASNLTNSWKITGERLARRKLSRWHYSNPFWRYAIAIAFWYGIVYYFGGLWAIPVYLFLGMCCVFSMKVSNYLQHYGLRRVLLANGRWEKVSPRHSWSADWKFSNWMFFKMQRHADHHAMATRPYQQLQHRSDESPLLPGTYGDMMNLVIQPKRWFAKIDPLVDQWRQHFYPEIEDWSPYDSSVSAARPDAFNEIAEVFSLAPRLAQRVEQSPELLDNLTDREFTDLSVPAGLLDQGEFDIARRGLTRLYWTAEMGVQEMYELIMEIPSANSKETAEIARNWTNDKSFQIGMHVLRQSLTTGEAAIALTNLAEAALTATISTTVTDSVEQGTVKADVGLAVFVQGELATAEAFPGVTIQLLLVFDDAEDRAIKHISRELTDRIAHITKDSLLFGPIRKKSKDIHTYRISELETSIEEDATELLPVFSATRGIWETGSTGLKQRFDDVRHKLVEARRKRELQLAPELERLGCNQTHNTSPFLRVSTTVHTLEKIARFLQVSKSAPGLDDSALTATKIFQIFGEQDLAECTTAWRHLHGIVHLILDDEIDLINAKSTVQAVVANTCGQDDFDALTTKMTEIDSATAKAIETLATRV